MKASATNSNTTGHWSVPVASSLKEGAGCVMVFEHQGSMDHGAVESLLAAAEGASLSAGDPVALRKRLFTVLVEGLDNMRLHAGDDHRESAFAVLVGTPTGYRLLMGN